MNAHTYYFLAQRDVPRIVVGVLLALLLSGVGQIGHNSRIGSDIRGLLVTRPDRRERGWRYALNSFLFCDLPPPYLEGTIHR